MSELFVAVRSTGRVDVSGGLTTPTGASARRVRSGGAIVVCRKLLDTSLCWSINFPKASWGLLQNKRENCTTLRGAVTRTLHWKVSHAFYSLCKFFSSSIWIRKCIVMQTTQPSNKFEIHMWRISLRNNWEILGCDHINPDLEFLLSMVSFFFIIILLVLRRTTWGNLRNCSLQEVITVALLCTRCSIGILKFHFKTGEVTGM
jgi:hypothetical protein